MPIVKTFLSGLGVRSAECGKKESADEAFKTLDEESVLKSMSDETFFHFLKSPSFISRTQPKKT